MIFQVSFCNKTKVPILGVVENMAKFVCPHCSHSSILFPSTTGELRSLHILIFEIFSIFGFASFRRSYSNVRGRKVGASEPVTAGTWIG